MYFLLKTITSPLFFVRNISSNVLTFLVSLLQQSEEATPALQTKNRFRINYWEITREITAITVELNKIIFVILYLKITSRKTLSFGLIFQHFEPIFFEHKTSHFTLKSTKITVFRASFIKYFFFGVS